MGVESLQSCSSVKTVKTCPSCTSLPRAAQCTVQARLPLGEDKGNIQYSLYWAVQLNIFWIISLL